MYEPLTFFIIATTFVLAGTVKGITGLGLPTVILALLTIVLDLHSAMALLIIPSLCTNLWQAFDGRHSRVVLKRCWPFLLPATLFIGLGGQLLTVIEPQLLSGLLGLLLICYASLNLLGMRLQITEEQSVWLGPVLGAINGTFTGMTGSFVVPGVLYLQSLGLTRDQLIQSMGMLFSLSTLALALSLVGQGLLNTDQLLLSFTGLLPALAGMVLGKKIRQKLSEELFRKVLFLALLLLGIYIVSSLI